MKIDKVAALSMQRIFSTFPDGCPGYGLLLLRVAGSLPLFVVGIGGGPADAAVWLRIFCCVSCVLMLSGFWTPFGAALQSILTAIFSISGPAFEWAYLIHGAIGLSLVMLGPGYWSIDARLYGRKRIDLTPAAPSSKREPDDS